MKHFADYTGSEFIAFKERAWKGMKAMQRKARSDAKRGYHRRERAALKRMVAELVADELARDEREAIFWERKVAEHADEYSRLSYERIFAYELGDGPSDLLLAGMAAENRLYSKAHDSMRAAVMAA